MVEIKMLDFLREFLRLPSTKERGKRFLAGLGLTALVFLVYFFLNLPDGRLHLYFFDVGQGDSLLILTPGGQKILIDGGPDEKVLDCLGQVLPFYERSLDLVILTHSHADHLAGLIEMVKRYRVGAVIANRLDYSSPEAEELLKAVEEKKLLVRGLIMGEKISLGGVVLECFWPPEERVGMKSNNPNLDSIVLRLDYGRFSALLTGDAENVVQQQLILLERTPLPVTVLKVPHQGAEDCCDQDFIKKIKPQLAIISVGRNQFGHPSKKALSLFKNLRIMVLRTDSDGVVEILSDGESWWLDWTREGVYEKD